MPAITVAKLGLSAGMAMAQRYQWLLDGRSMQTVGQPLAALKTGPPATAAANLPPTLVSEI